MDSKEKFMEVLQEALDLHRLQCSEEKANHLYTFYVELVEMNKVMNLTAITEMTDVVYKHFIDCMLIDSFQLLKGGMKIIDVGTGAGFPGLVLAIMHDDQNFVLMDSLQKRVHFLKELSLKLGLENVELIHARAEELAFKPEFREQFDIAVSRAVANLSTLSEYCIPFVKQGGKFIAYKSQGIDEEIQNASRSLSLLGGELLKVEKFCLNFEDNLRSLVIIEKKNATPRKYPRKSGTPAKQPL